MTCRGLSTALPGVRSTAISAAMPLTWKRITPVLPEGQPDVPLAQRPFLDIEAVSPQWFQTMRVPLRGGREFTDADNAQAPKVVIVNESFAKRFWPNENPVGKHVVVGRWPDPAEVVGVAADVKNKGLAQDTQAQLYLAYPQLPWGNMNLLVRTTVPPMSLATAVRAQIAAVDPDQPVTGIRTVETDGRWAHAAEVHDDAAELFLGRGAGAGGDWNLRRAGVLCGRTPVELGIRLRWVRSAGTSCGWCCGRDWNWWSPES